MWAKNGAAGIDVMLGVNIQKRVHVHAYALIAQYKHRINERTSDVSANL